MKHGKKILVVAATEAELRCVEPVGAASYSTYAVCGIGKVEAYSNTAELLSLHCPDFVLMIGIAGAYPDSGLKVGDSVLVSGEHDADLGVLTDKGFSKFKQNSVLECPHMEGINCFDKVVSNTVSTAATPNLEETGAKIENMEGYSFFMACIKYKVPFMELRTVSNIVSTKRDSWNKEMALDNLCAAMKKLVSDKQFNEIISRL